MDLLIFVIAFGFFIVIAILNDVHEKLDNLRYRIKNMEEGKKNG